MQPTLVNILDQLLGVQDLTAPTELASGVSGEQDGQLFRDILSRLGVDPQNLDQIPELAKLAEGQDGVADAHGEAGSEADFLAELGNAEIAGEAAHAEAANRALAAAGQLRAMLPTTDTDVAPVEQPLVDYRGAEPKVATAPVVRPESQIVEDFATRVAANPQWKALQQWQPAQLESAVYKISESHLSNDRLELTLAGSGENGEAVKVSLPSEILTATRAANGSRRVSLKTALPVKRDDGSEVSAYDQTTSQASRREMARLMQDLRLTSLDLSQNDRVSRREPDAAPVTVRLTAEKAGRQIVLQQKMTHRDLRMQNANADKTNNGTVRPNMTPSDRMRHDALTGNQPNPRGSRPSTQPEAVPSKIATSRQPFTLGDRPAGGATTFSTEGAFVTDDAAGTSFERASTKAMSESRQVRFTLPKELGTTGRPLNQTLLLKIEPEHLGPARLQLSVRHEVLTARVLVDTPVAKATVEQSLDQLTDQLNRVGVQVDRIEVALSGGDARNEFLDRRPAWAHQLKTKQRYFDDDDEIEQAAAVESARLKAAAQYVGQGSVNLLA